MQLSKLKLIGFIAFISVSAFASWDEEQPPEYERQMGSFHNEDSRSAKKKKSLCDSWINMQDPELPTSELQPLPAKIMDFSRPSQKQMGDNEESTTSDQMQ